MVARAVMQVQIFRMANQPCGLPDPGRCHRARYVQVVQSVQFMQDDDMVGTWKPSHS
jgi:hypothetical protein